MKFLLNVSSIITSIITSFFTAWLIKVNNTACRETDRPDDISLQYHLCIYSHGHHQQFLGDIEKHFIIVYHKYFLFYLHARTLFKETLWTFHG